MGLKENTLAGSDGLLGVRGRRLQSLNFDQKAMIGTKQYGLSGGEMIDYGIFQN
jgi:hypothetical protein